MMKQVKQNSKKDTHNKGNREKTEREGVAGLSRENEKNER